MRPIRLTGQMWWDNPTTPASVKEFVLFDDRFAFSVRDGDDTLAGTLYQGALVRCEVEADRFSGTFKYGGGDGTARCRLTEQDGEYELVGDWFQAGKRHEWHAILYPSD